MPSRPLIEEIEGREADDRASLLSAFYRVLHSRRRCEVCDLHVRELLTYVLASDRDGRGVQMSYDDIGKALCCERSTARSVVRRCDEIYGLLAIIEDRYARGGQAPNRYSIDWQGVRSVNLGGSPPPNGAAVRHGSLLPSADSVAGFESVQSCTIQSDAQTVSRRVSDAMPSAEKHTEEQPAQLLRTGGRPAVTRAQAGVTTVHPGVTRAQGAVTTVHPYKEDTLISSLRNTAAAAAWAAAAIQAVDFEEVVRRANQLRGRCRSLDREFVWQAVLCGEMLDRGKSGEWLSRITEGHVQNVACWLKAALRRELEQLGLDWRLVRQHLPPPSPPPAQTPGELPPPAMAAPAGRCS